MARKGKREKPARRNIIHRHAKLRSGAGFHKDKRKSTRSANKVEIMQMTLSEFKAEHGICNGTDMMDALEEWNSDGIVPAMCKEGCEVEPDGICEHGCQSILLRMGVI